MLYTSMKISCLRPSAAVIQLETPGYTPTSVST